MKKLPAVISVFTAFVRVLVVCVYCITLIYAVGVKRVQRSNIASSGGTLFALKVNVCQMSWC